MLSARPSSIKKRATTKQSASLSLSLSLPLYHRSEKSLLFISLYPNLPLQSSQLSPSQSPTCCSDPSQVLLSAFPIAHCAIFSNFVAGQTMDFMKVLDQTVREIKREVNLKVLKVPEIEQKVLDATDNEPWGPHGSALAEIAQATKKFSECQMVMNVLWTRLSETGRDWRHVYKALAVIDYLVANGSERAVDDIIEHTFQISSLSGFEHVEPSGKDVGINVRKKAETIVGLLNNKDKIQEVRNKASANRDKYFGLSSSGVTYKSGSASYGISGGFQSSERYGGLRSTHEGDTFKNSYRDRDRFDEGKFDRDTSTKSYQGSENHGTSRKSATHYSSKDQDSVSSSSKNPTGKINDSDKHNSVPSQTSNMPSNIDEDDFDPRGISTTKSAAGKVEQVDLFGQSLVGDLMDAPTLTQSGPTAVNSRNSSDVDLFADATFVSASPHTESGESSQAQTKVDLFASQPALPSASSATVGFLTAPDPVIEPEAKLPSSGTIDTSTVDPFAAVPLNNFDGSDLFSAFTSHADSGSAEYTQKTIPDGLAKDSNGNPSSESKTLNKKDNFQVKSGVWADTLSRGLIDLNISAPKKVSLVDVGIVGGLGDGSDEKEKGPATTFKGRAMGAGSGLGRSGHTPTATDGDDFFSSLSSQQNLFSGFSK